MEALLNLVRKPSPQRLASTLLEDAERTLLEISGNREYYAGMEQVLLERIERLRNEVRIRTKESINGTENSSGRRLNGGLTD